MRDPYSISKKSIAVSILIILLFFLPLALILTGLGRISDEEFAKNENRYRTKLDIDLHKPSFIKMFPENFDNWFNDNFPYRDSLISFYRNLSFGMFQKTNTDNADIVGKNGYYFLGDFYNENINIYANRKILDPPQITLLQNSLRNVKLFLDRRNTKFYFIVAPSKASIYSEFLPDWANIKKNQVNIYDQVMDILESEGINHTDLMHYFFELKKKPELKPYLYFKSDSHWSELGAYYAYKAIIDLMCKQFPQLKPIKMSGFEVSDEGVAGDIAKRLKFKYIDDFKIIPNLAYEDHELEAYDLRTDTNITIDTTYASSSPLQRREDYYTITNKFSDNRLHILFSGDSFHPWLRPFLNRTFYKITYCDYDFIHLIHNTFQNYLSDYIKTKRPDAFLMEITTRNLPFQALQLFFGILPGFDRNESAIAFNVLKREIFTLDHDSVNQIETVNQCLPASENGSLIINSTGNDPFVIFRKIDNVKQNESLILEIILDSPVVDNMQIFYQTKEKPFFDNINSISIPTMEGENKLYAEIYNYDLNGLIKLKPGSNAGKYIIKSLVIKSCPKDFVFPKQR